jgi:hypothetical protein
MKRLFSTLVVIAAMSLLVACESAVLVNNDAGHSTDPALEAQPANERVRPANPAEPGATADPDAPAQPAQAELSAETSRTSVQKQND